MGNRFSRRPNVAETAEQQTSVDEAQEVQEEKSDQCPPECQQVVNPAVVAQTNDAEPKPEAMECQAPVQLELPPSTKPEPEALAQALIPEPEALAQALIPEPEVLTQALIPEPEVLAQALIPEPEALAQALIPEPEALAQALIPEPEALAQALIPEPEAKIESNAKAKPVAEPEIVSAQDAKIDFCSEAAGLESAFSPEIEADQKPLFDNEELVPEPDSTSGQEAIESSVLVPEPDSTSGPEAEAASESVEPEAIACTEADVMIDPIPNTNQETKPDSEPVCELESTQSSEEEEEEEPAEPEPMVTESNELEPDTFAQEPLTEQISLIPLVNAEITDVTPSSDPIPENTDADEPSDATTSDQVQDEEPSDCLEPKEPEEPSQEPLVEPKSCIDVFEESVCESLKNLELKGKDLVDALIPSDAEISNDISPSTELM